MRAIAVIALLVSALSLSSCIAIVVPVAAAGVIGKKQIDAAKKRARQAEQSVADVPIPAPVETRTMPSSADAEIPELPQTGIVSDALNQFNLASIQNAYLPFARYVLDQAGKRTQGLPVRSAVLVNQVSLIDPQTLPCENKPMAAVIDLDIAPGTPAEIEIEAQNGFGTLLQTLRDNDVRIVWAGSKSAKASEPTLDALRKGDNPALRDTDMILLRDGKFSKQEQRWILARSYCVLAVAGDRKGDFDELYDYLRDPDYAIRLEAFMDRGWFLLPHPVAAMDSPLGKKVP
jgi:hypothetical protein